MKNIIRLSESDLTRIVKRVIRENEDSYQSIVKDLLDNFDNNRKAKVLIDKLKDMNKWQDFMKSDEGKMFKELRNYL
jgi:predicted DNA binding CopG/RHH family protein